MDNRPYFTIITATYNAAKTLQDCIDSVRSQTGVDIEQIIIDGASDDGTVEIIKRAAERKDTKITWWQTEPDTGIYNAWNKAIRNIRGQWVIFFGSSDTFWQPSTLSSVKSKLDCVSDSIRVAYGQVDLILPSGELLKRYGSDWSIFKKRYRDGEQLAHQGVFHRKDLLTNGNFFDESFCILADDLLLKEELMTGDACFIDIKIANMVAGGISTSINHLAEAISEHRRICAIYNIPRNRIKRYLFYFITAIKLVLLRRCPRALLAHLLDLGRVCRGKRRYYTKMQD